MSTTAPTLPPVADDRDLEHAGTTRRTHEPDGAARRLTAVAGPGEDGSLVTEYGLLVVVAATIAGVVINWASNGQIVTLFNALLRQARSLVGA